MIRSLSLAFVAAFVAGCTTTTQGPSTSPVLGPGVAQVTSNQELDASNQRNFAMFAADGESFGTMFVSASGGFSYWRTGSFTLADVTQEAKAVCEALSGEACAQYATLTPEGGNAPKALPQRAVPGLKKAMRRTGEGKYAALAVMPTGAYGYSYDYDTIQEATDRAIAECRARIPAEQADYTEAQVASLSAQGLFDCRLFQTFRR